MARGAQAFEDVPPYVHNATEEDLDRELLPRDLRLYLPDAWCRALPASTPFVHNWHHDAIAEHLQAVSLGEIRQLIISVAPRHTKSWITCVFWPTWHWTRWPETQWVFGAYGMDLATRDAVYSRRLMADPWYVARFACRCDRAKAAQGGQMHEAWCKGFRWTTDQNVKTLYENDRGGRRLTASVEAGTTGQGGDILVLDDPIDIMKAASEQVRKNAHSYVDQVFLGRRNDPATSRVVVIAQRTHHEDVTGHLLAEGGWEHLCLPTEYEVPPQVEVTSIGWRDPRTKPDELLWPGRYTLAVVANEKIVKGPYGYSAQHQQRPSPIEGGVLRRDNWRFWQPKGAQLPDPVSKEGFRYPPATELPLTWMRVQVGPGAYRTGVQQGAVERGEVDEMLQSWDCSFKGIADSIRKGKLPDPVSGGAWARRGAQCFLLDRENARLDITETIAAIRVMCLCFPDAVQKLIEDKANGPAIITLLRHEVGGIIPVTPRVGKVARVMTAAATDLDKDARAMSMVAILDAHNVYLPHPAIAPWVWDYIEEHAQFPAGATDDDVDMTSQALSKMQPWIWRDATMQQSEVMGHGSLPPVTDTRELHRRIVGATLTQAKKPDTFRDPYRR